jgi:hypothetical protein
MNSPDEICGNNVDDNGDGAVDENCPPPPTDGQQGQPTQGSDENGSTGNGDGG